ncbi:hypothetical protein N7535_005709 [Penicillium sp. DV-2018c]|nr:hypothetical protein N7461_009284 [Penicillium sp. DV-2018c]KAJ5572049.1 hypothetical protein N7535_005709 [Penicillium sp. DV-2018c]
MAPSIQLSQRNLCCDDQTREKEMPSQKSTTEEVAEMHGPAAGLYWSASPVAQPGTTAMALSSAGVQNLTSHFPILAYSPILPEQQNTTADPRVPAAVAQIDGGSVMFSEMRKITHLKNLMRSQRAQPTRTTKHHC